MEATQPVNGDGSSVLPMMSTVAIQPIPTEVSANITPDNRWTSIVRFWIPGDPARCKLCPSGTCIARKMSDVEYCHLDVPGAISARDATYYSSAGNPRVTGRPITPVGDMNRRG